MHRCGGPRDERRRHGGRREDVHNGRHRGHRRWGIIWSFWAGCWVVNWAVGENVKVAGKKAREGESEREKWREGEREKWWLWLSFERTFYTREKFSSWNPPSGQPLTFTRTFTCPVMLDVGLPTFTFNEYSCCQLSHLFLNCISPPSIPRLASKNCTQTDLSPASLYLYFNWHSALLNTDLVGEKNSKWALILSLRSLSPTVDAINTTPLVYPWPRQHKGRRRSLWPIAFCFCVKQFTTPTTATSVLLKLRVKKSKNCSPSILNYLYLYLFGHNCSTTVTHLSNMNRSTSGKLNRSNINTSLPRATTNLNYNALANKSNVLTNQQQPKQANVKQQQPPPSQVTQKCGKSRGQLKGKLNDEKENPQSVLALAKSFNFKLQLDHVAGEPCSVSTQGDPFYWKKMAQARNRQLVKALEEREKLIHLIQQAKSENKDIRSLLGQIYD